LAHEPCGFARKVNAVLCFGAVRGSHTHDRKVPRERPLRSLSPDNSTECAVLLDEARSGAWGLSDHRADPRSPHFLALRHRDLHVLGVHGLGRQDSDRPREPALAESVSKIRAHSISRVGERTAEAHSHGTNPIDLIERNTPLRSIGYG